MRAKQPFSHVSRHSMGQRSPVDQARVADPVPAPKKAEHKDEIKRPPQKGGDKGGNPHHRRGDDQQRVSHHGVVVIDKPLHEIAAVRVKRPVQPVDRVGQDRGRQKKGEGDDKEPVGPTAREGDGRCH